MFDIIKTPHFFQLKRIEKYWLLSHIKHCRLFKAKSSLYMYIEYVWFRLFLWHINYSGYFNSKSSLYMYTEYIWFR